MCLQCMVVPTWLFLTGGYLEISDADKSPSYPGQIILKVPGLEVARFGAYRLTIAATQY